MKMRTTICAMFALASTALYAGPQAFVEGESSAKFGSYPAKEAKTATFTIANKGDATLKILGVRNTCDCVESGISIGAEINARNCEIPPGGKAALKLKVLPDSVHEPYIKNVYVQTDDPANKFLVFTISGDAIPILKAVHQSEIMAGHIKLNSTWTHALDLEAIESGVEVGPPDVESDVLLKATAECVSEKAFKLKIEITPNVPGRFSAKVFVPILKPEGWKPLEVDIAGFAGIELLASPAKIFIPANATNRFEKTIELRVFSPAPIKLKPEDISFTAPNGAAINLSGKDGDLVIAKISIDPTSLGALTKSPAIEFKMAGAKTLSIPLIRR